jgi:molybdate transport system substrate-binding protein
VKKHSIGFLAVVFASIAWGAADAAEIKVLASNAIKEAYVEFAPLFEKTSGHKLNTAWHGTNDILAKLRAGENFDLVIAATPALNLMVKESKVAAGSIVDLVRSGIGVGVPKGAPKPDISSGDAIRKHLLTAKGVGFSTGPSGVFLEGLFKKWGIYDQIKGKLKQTKTGVPVATLIVSGDVDIGFQQVSEIMLYPGIQYVGALPADIQHITVFSGGIHAAAKQPDAARALVKFILSPAALPHIKHAGLEQGSK